MAMESVTSLLKPATPDEAEAFITQNKKFLPGDAEQVFRKMDPMDQRRVMTQGNLSSVRDPGAVLQSRAKKGRELEAELGRAGAAAAADTGAAQEAEDRSNRMSKPATPEELETFIKANDRWLSGEALAILRGMKPIDQKRVISSGTMSGCRDPVAVVQTRAKKARELEENLVALPEGKSLQGTAAMPSVLPSPVFGAQAAVMHMFAMPQAVTQEESKFAPPPGAPAEEAPVAGNICGIGGVIEILKAKYGCGKGQKLRVIGETDALWKFEDGKTAPKNQENKGWRWVLQEAEPAAQPREAAPPQTELKALDEKTQERAKQLAAEVAAKNEELAKSEVKNGASKETKRSRSKSSSSRSRKKARTSARSGSGRASGKKKTRKSSSSSSSSRAKAKKGSAARKGSARRRSRSKERAAESKGSKKPTKEETSKKRKAASKKASSSSSS